MRSYKALSIRRHSGSIVTATPAITTNLVRDNGAALTDDEIIQEALNILASRTINTPAMANPQTTRDYLAMHYAGLEYEVFSIIYLTNKHRVIAIEDLFRGTLSAANVYPRECLKVALQHNAAAVIMAHNHPGSYDSEPSEDDLRLTRRLKDVFAMIDIRVLDHIVVAGPNTTSFAERGLL